MLQPETAEPSFLVLFILAIGIGTAVLGSSNHKPAMPWQVGAPLIGLIVMITLPMVLYFSRRQQFMVGEIPNSPPTELALGGFVIALTGVLFAATKFLTQSFDRPR